MFESAARLANVSTWFTTSGKADPTDFIHPDVKFATVFATSAHASSCPEELPAGNNYLPANVLDCGAARISALTNNDPSE